MSRSWPPRTQVHRADGRCRTRAEGLDLRHAFSAGVHYDPHNTGHALLLVHDEVVVAGGAGFGMHRHRDEEVVTWVLSGALAHADSSGRVGVVTPGVVQRMSAGTGLEHSELNADRDPGGSPVRFLQMRVVPDRDGRAPDHEQRDVAAALGTGELVPVASGRPGHEGAVRLGSRHAALHVARLLPDQPVRLPEAPFLHLHVARGRVELEGTGELRTGDAVRATATGGARITAAAAAEVLVWEMHADLC